MQILSAQCAPSTCLTASKASPETTSTSTHMNCTFNKQQVAPLLPDSQDNLILASAFLWCNVTFFWAALRLLCLNVLSAACWSGVD